MSPFDFVTGIFQSSEDCINNTMKTVFGEDGSIRCEANGNVVTMGNGNFFNFISQSSGTTVVSSSNQLKTKVDSDARSFKKVSVYGPFNVVYTADNHYGVDVDFDGSPSILDHITIYVKDDTLFIQPIGSFSYTGSITVNIKAPFIIGVEVNGSGTFRAKSNVSSSSHDVSLKVKGSGDIILHKLYAKNLLAEVNGSGDISAKYAEVKKETILKIAGSGDIEINTLYSTTVSGNVAGSGDIVVHDTHAESMQHQVSGSGDIEFC